MKNTIKQVKEIFNATTPHLVGDGFRVQNLFPNGNKLGKSISPFFLLDYAAPAYFPPVTRPRGVDEHPHRGFETVTVVYQGELSHRDSAGNSGQIAAGDVQWMTAASGIVHEEKHTEAFSKKGGTIEMAQLWVNLPKAHKMSKPGYQTLLKDQIPVVSVGEGSHVRVIAGEFNGIKGPASTFSPVNLWDVQLKAGQSVTLPLPDKYNTGIVVMHGEVNFNQTHTAESITITLFDTEGDHVTVTAITDAKLLVLNGEPIDEPVFAYGPFVMNTQEEIAEAIKDYNDGKMGHIR
jgi:redox-sensitive bicupin YhaK (pirin superfamily)